MSGTRWSMRIHTPAMSAYQVCACTTSASRGSRAMASPIDSVSSAGANAGPSPPALSRSHGVYPRTAIPSVDGARSPKHRTSTPIRRLNARDNSPTTTPAPP